MSECCRNAAGMWHVASCPTHENSIIIGSFALAMNALSTLKWPSSGNQSINDNGVYRLLLRPQKCRVSVKRQMVNGKHAHAPEVCNIVWLLAEWRGGGRGGEEGQTEILLIKFAKLFAIKPLSCWTNNVQHATASSKQQQRSNKYNNLFENYSAYRHLCLISISLYLALRRLLYMFINLLRCRCCCPSMGQVFLHCGCCSTSPHACKSVCVSQCVCVEVILKIASQESSPLLLPSAPSSLYQLLLLLLLFDLRGKSYVQCPLLTIAGAASACPRLDICTHKYT